MTPDPMSRATNGRKAPFLSRLGRWTAELMLVFVGVYGAFRLNNYQQHQQDAKRRDQILASLEEQLKEGIDSTKTEGAKQGKIVSEFRRALDADEMPPLHPRLPLRRITTQAISRHCSNQAESRYSMSRLSRRCASSNRSFAAG